MPADQQTYTVKQCALVVGVSVGTIGNLRKNKALNFPKPIPTGLRHLRFRADEINAYARYGAFWDQHPPFGGGAAASH